MRRAAVWFTAWLAAMWVAFTAGGLVGNFMGARAAR